ncbi:MAG: amino acid permease [Simkaniaceae bacterium]|nr:amino acid permease [Simkaniaceae bacterium]
MTQRTLNVFLLTMINLATILSIKNWPFTAGLGLASIFYIGLGALIFFIPVALVAAELATGWPERGGVFAWVKEGLGHKWGFLAIWLLWVENVVWYPTILSFIAGSLAYLIDPELASNNIYAFGVIFVVYWAATLANLKGMKASSWISTFGMIVGTLIPGGIIILLGFYWLGTGQPHQLQFSWDGLVPDLSNFSQLAVLAGIALGFGGIEMPAVHARDVINPQRNYPRAIFLSATIIIILSVLGSLAIAAVVPPDRINLLSGSVEAISVFLTKYNLSWAIPILALLMAIGAIGGMSTWLAGPPKGLLAAAQAGDLPPFLHKVNKHDMPSNMMITQGIIVSALAMVFLFFPSVNTSFWILIAMSAQLYLVMYALMFIAAIRLRYKKPDVPRAYRVPGGNVGMWIVSGIGLLASVFFFLLAFVPVEQAAIDNVLFYEAFLIIGIAIFCYLPFLILKFKRSSWLES